MLLNLFSSSLFEINMNGSIVHFNKIQIKKSHPALQKDMIGGGLSLKRKVRMVQLHSIS